MLGLKPFRSLDPNWHDHLGERLGILPPAVRELRTPIWVHAASVGEVLAAEPLVRALKRERPGLAILVTTTSLTGRRAADERLPADAVMLLPADLPWIVACVLRRLRPVCLLVIETEIWPSLLYGAARRAIPCAMVSGRLSTRSANRYRRASWLLRPVLARMDAFAMQSGADAERIVALGAPADRVSVTGNLKFARGRGELRQRSAARAVLFPPHRPVLLAASTHAGEEQLVVDACLPLWAEHPGLLLAIAPRRPERFSDVEALLRQRGVTAERRTRVSTRVADDAQVLLIDTVGELPDLMASARAVYVGGSLGEVGGHNVIEPASHALPVAFGPHTRSVAEQCDALLRAGAAARVRNAAELSHEWRRLLNDSAAAVEMGRRGQAVVGAEAKVLDDTMAVVRRLLPIESAR